MSADKNKFTSQDGRVFDPLRLPPWRIDKAIVDPDRVCDMQRQNCNNN